MSAHYLMIQRGTRIAVVIATALLCSAFPRVQSGSAMAAAGGARVLADDDDKRWKPLGYAVVKKVADRDEINVGSDEGDFRKIKLEARGADVEIEKLKVVYSNGGDEELDVREKIRDGKQTRAIDLKGGERHIRKVVLVYKTDADEKRDARVYLFGWR